MFLILALALACGCSDDKTPPVVPDTTGPRVVFTVPADDDTGVALDATIRAVFSEPIDPATASTATFLISDGLAGMVECRMDTLRFIPDSFMAGSHLYTATLTTGIKDISGNALASDYSWSFTTLDPGIMMPLAVGNQWDYEVTFHDTIPMVYYSDTAVRITSTILVGNELFYVDQMGDRYANRANGLWRKRLGSSLPPYLAAALPAGINDSAYYDSQCLWEELIKVRLLAIDTMVTTPAGTFLCHMYQGGKSTCTMTYGVFAKVFFSPGVGFVKLEKTYMHANHKNSTETWELSGVTLL